MDKIEKLFRKISKDEIQLLKELINNLILKKTEGMNIIKIEDTDFFRLKKRKFRIIFHYNNKDIIIDSIKLRNEKTYKC
ncbi:MAG: hypothetical protein WC909_00950 [Candidatus Paceibacterota bacterium]|jgi:mRNA-degrading endonuclease RelE of RelBE toxin-antitoxin system